MYVLPEHVSRTLGKDAQRTNILAAKLVADIVKTTLGPKGMDKMLVDSSGNVIITNDGVTILEEMDIDHPAAKMMVEIAKTQEEEVGDGTTTAALLAGKLLEYAEGLLDQRIHPTAIVKGYRLAAEKSLEILNGLALPVRDKQILQQIAMTAMTGKGAEGHKEKLARLIVDAVDQIAPETLHGQALHIQKVKGESILESELIQGFVLDKEKAHSAMPSRVVDAKILLLDIPLEIHGPEGDTKISVSTPEQLESFLASEERSLKAMTQAIISSGAKVVFCQKGIDDVAQYYLAKEGILAYRRVPKSALEKIARAISSMVFSNLHDLSADKLGYAAVVEEVFHGQEAYVYIRGCKNPKSVTILIRGSTAHVLDEIERAMKDGLGDVLAAVQSGKVVAGGGAVEIALARQLRAYARTLGGREQLAVDEFARALESIPLTLAENAGLDPIDVLTELKKRHEAGLPYQGLNLFTDKVEDTFAAGIIEPLKVKTQAISSAVEVATMILRIDDVLISKGSSGLEPRYEGME